MPVPADFEQVRARALRLVALTPGHLSLREACFLMLAAAGAPREGTVLEIGSYKGRSTVALASIVRQYGLGRVVAVDPHTSPSSTDPDLRAQGKTTSWDDFVGNLERAGVRDTVEAHRELSGDLARRWHEPLRLLWIDGDHTYEGARADLDLYRPFLVDGAIVAMHDVLGTWEGSLRVFVEHVLGSDDFGPAGFCGSIGWAQYRPRDGRRFRAHRRRLAWPASHLIPVARAGRAAVGLDKWRYKLWRTLAPHGDVDPARWMRRIAR